MGLETTSTRFVLNRWFWLTTLVLWTILLALPGNWFPGSVSGRSVSGIGFGELLHVGAYSLLAATAAWLPGTRTKRTVAVLALFLHGGATELIQTQVPYREGCWMDVGIDSAAVFIGWMATLPWRPA